MREIFYFLFLPNIVFSQIDGLGALKLPEELEYREEEEEPQTKDILVIPNRFPKELNFFCYPRSGLQHDRICFGQLDAFALACADDTPPLQLVPFCVGFKEQCSQVNYPQESWCDLERSQYKKFCTRNKRQSCKSCHYDLSCSCEPFECIWRRYGFETARWCQKYELFCDNKVRREKAQELVSLMQDAVKVHYRCFHMFNLPQVICNPFRRQFDHPRCTKFLFDCELISDFEEEKSKGKEEESTEEGFVSPTEIPVTIAKGKEIPIPEGEKQQLKKIQIEEDNLAKEIAKAEAAARSGTTVGPVPVIAEPVVGLLKQQSHPFNRITLPPRSDSPPMIASTTVPLKLGPEERPKSPFKHT